MAIFQPRPLHIPNLTTNYAAENSAFANLGQTLGNLIPDMRKERLQAQKEQALLGLGEDIKAGNFQGAAAKALTLGELGAGATLLTLGQKAKERDSEAQFFKNFGLGGAAAAPSTSGVSTSSASASGTPRGLRNLNPGNIEDGGFAQSQPGYAGSDGRFAKFDTLENGVNAQGKLLETYNRKYGINTVAGVVNRWAPEAENGAATGNYASFVARKLGVGANDPIDLTNPETQRRVALAMAEFENGRPVQLGSSPQVAATRPVPQQPVQVAENEADVQRLERQQEAEQPIAGDDPTKLRADAQYYANTNPEAARQLNARADALERSRGVQVAQAPAQSGTPIADAPAQGAAPAQGFVIPGSGEVVSQETLAGNPRLQQMIRAYAIAPTDRARSFVKQQMDLELADIKQRQERTRQQVRPLTDPSERARYGITEDDKAPYQIDGNGRVTAVGGNRTNVNIDQRGETEEAKAIGQAAGKRAGEMMAAASSGTKQLQRIGQLEALLKNVESGRLQPGRMNMAALGKSVGVNEDFLRSIGLDPTHVGDAQAINAITGRMVVDMIGSGGFPANNFSDADRAFITGTVPSLANDPRGNKIIMEAAKRTAQIDIEKAKAWREWRKDNKGGSFDDFEVQWGEKLASQDRFADLAKQAEAITGPQQPAVGGWQDLGGGIRIRQKQ